MITRSNKQFLIRRSALGAVLVAMLAISTFSFPSIAQAAPETTNSSSEDEPGVSTAGREFWLDFDANLAHNSSPYLKLFISGSEGTSGSVAITGLAFQTTFLVPSDGIATVDIPLAARGAVDYPGVTSADGIGALAPIAIHVLADNPVTIYGINRAQFTTDAYLGLPITALGQRYRLVDYAGSRGALMSVVATQDGTTIHVDPDPASGLPAFDKELSTGQVFEWELSDEDIGLTGTLVTSDKPVAVFAGNRCTTVPAGYGYCDHIIEQMNPTNTWGKTFVTFPLHGRSQDTFRIVADRDGTTVTIQRQSGTETHDLTAGSYYELLSGEPMTITSSQPVEVAQYSNGSEFDDTISDPFMALVPPYEQGFTDSTFATPVDGFTNYVNITALTSDISGVLLDGSPIPEDLWEAIPGSDYSGTAVPIDAGSHTLESTRAIQTLVYGFATDDSYGYPGGLRIARIADATVLTVTPPDVSGLVDSQLCTTATLSDTRGTGIAGARLDVTITGVVADDLSVVTRDDGTASICATSPDVGTAQVVVTQSTLSATASLTWINEPEIQRATVVYIDSDNGSEVTPVVGTQTSFLGDPGMPIGTTNSLIAAGVPVGYDIVSIGQIGNFDSDSATDQIIVVQLKHQSVIKSVPTGGSLATMPWLQSIVFLATPLLLILSSGVVFTLAAVE